MAIKINFDNNHNVIPPTLVLVTRNGRKSGSIPYENLVVKDGMKECAELSFSVNKAICEQKKKALEQLGANYVSNSSIDIWERLVDFKLVWVRDWNKLFEINVEINESNDTVKDVSAKELGVAELSQIYLYNIEINTENDILREDYEPTVFYDETNSKASLLSRILEKAPHYRINHVDYSLKNIQRTFEFDGDSIYDSFSKIEEEINCLFDVDCSVDEEGNITRLINVFDLESYCVDCGERGLFDTTCDKCNSDNIIYGYGEDTTIFISTDNLADNITYTTDAGSVKNCFKLEAGDDLMTATITNCNPNGSSYIWFISDMVKRDMPQALVNKLNSYDDSYDYYQNEYVAQIDINLINTYNELIDKYSICSSDYKKISTSIVGYPALMQAYYNTIDFHLYLNDGLMPSVEMQSTTATQQVAKLTRDSLSPVAVKNLESCSKATADSAVLAMAKVVVDKRYQVKISSSSYSSNTWSGYFDVTSYSDENDTARSNYVTCTINDNYEDYVKQKLDKSLNKATSDSPTDIVTLFKLPLSQFIQEIKKYSLNYLKSFYECCEGCVNILIEQGVADNETWANTTPNLYNELYLPYYEKLRAIGQETKVRESEISVIIGEFNADGERISNGLQTVIIDERNKIQKELDFEKYLGNELWLEFVAYRREDTYSNDNYISDGLDNAELFKNANEFIEVAKKEIYKSATLQHSISATLKNLLVMKEFEPIIRYFEVGNWLKIRIDDVIYRLRLLDYEVDFNDFNNISITFSDVIISPTGVNDVNSILNSASSMASSYGAVSRQAKQGKKGSKQIDDWVDKGLDLTNMSIVDNAQNQNISWGKNGILLTEFLPITDTYDDKQLKIINKGLYVTNDNWQTAKAGIGNFTFYNPETKQMEEGYGVIADKLVGNLILSERVGIYNENNNIILDKNGVSIIADNTQNNNQTVFSIKRRDLNNSNEEYLTDLLYINENGELVLNGTIKIQSPSQEGGKSFDEVVQGTLDYTDDKLNEYKNEVGKYMTFNNTDGLALGDATSPFKLVINNERIEFRDNDTVMSYFQNQLLNIPNAVIEQSLTLGKFVFSPLLDGGFTIVWAG